MDEESESKQQPSSQEDEAGGSYELIRRRLIEQAKALGVKAEALNQKRIETFGSSEMTVIGNERIRTENNCVPRDIVVVRDKILFGYNVFIGLKSKTSVSDVFSMHRFVTTDQGFDLNSYASGSEETRMLDQNKFVTDFQELYEYYKDARLMRLWRGDAKLLAVFQIGPAVDDIRVFRWALFPDKPPQYIDNRGERDYVFPPSHDFEWTVTTREHHISGAHPHVSVMDEVFVETVGGDLTIKVENNTETGEGIYSEPVDEAGQSLDDAEISYARVGTLILLKIRPYREEVTRYLVFATRTQKVVRIDAIGKSCVQLPEDHGLIFPGGYYLQGGQYKVFDGDFNNFEFERTIRSPNGEDVLYVFHHRVNGIYTLLSYNLINKEIQTPILCNGYSLFKDGKMAIFRAASDEPARVHPMQIWQTPFMRPEYAASVPTGQSFLEKVGNSDLVRGISDAYSIRRAITETEPSKQIYEDLIRLIVRTVDAYFWLDNDEAGNIKTLLSEIKDTAELIVEEFVKVTAMHQQAAKQLADLQEKQLALTAGLRPDSYTDVDQFMSGLNELRTQRGRLISLREVRFIDQARLEELQAEVIKHFDRLSAATIDFLLDEKAMIPLHRKLEELLGRIETVDKTKDLIPLSKQLDETNQGLGVLSEVIAGLKVDDPTVRTEILERISEVFSLLNRVQATLENHRKKLLVSEGRSEFAAQFKLFGQSVQSAMALADTPERCDEQLSRLMVQLEELEARFSEFEEFLGDLAAKRDEVYDALEQRKQSLLDERQHRVQTLMGAAERILASVARRAKGFKNDDELNSYFAADPMVLKLQDIQDRLLQLGDSTEADGIQAKLKAARQDALRGLRDRIDLFTEGENIIKMGNHHFYVNTDELELTLLPYKEDMALHLSGTDFWEPIEDVEFNQARVFWHQRLVSEDENIYRGEYLAATIIFAAQEQRDGLSIPILQRAQQEENGLLNLVRKIAQVRFDEGYDRGLHDNDAALILEALLPVRDAAGLLRYSPTARAYGCLFWSLYDDAQSRATWHRRAHSLGRLRSVFTHSTAISELSEELTFAMQEFFERIHYHATAALMREAGGYLTDELSSEQPRFTLSGEALKLKEAFYSKLQVEGTKQIFEQDLEALKEQPVSKVKLAEAWLCGFLDTRDAPDEEASLYHIIPETAVLLATEGLVDRAITSVHTTVKVERLLGQHKRINANRQMTLRLDEFLSRLSDFIHTRVPGYRKYRELRQSLLERERARLRLEEYKPRVLTSFVRNMLINDVYLPLIGDNLAKQLGASGEKKRTDLMGLLMLISPPGYGKTTLMEYIASRMGLVFMKVNGPSLGHAVRSLDPEEAPNATARQEVDKINLALQMGNNVMLYLDDIQHTNAELLQKFISLCDAQRRIEGVWGGRTRTYDLRGKRFCVVMAGNPYTESGEKFQIPDMLANRADTYNLGDILGGHQNAFELSYIENAITSNKVLAPLAARDQADIYKLIRIAQGEEIPSSELSHSYSAVEINEIIAVLKRLLVIQRVVLKINQQYIASASTDDAFRTEPAFKLQGSYRNMNKMAEKVVAVMNDQELNEMIADHYIGEAQTLTSGAEHNMLKLAELRGDMTAEQSERWEQIKRDFKRIKDMGGDEEDPAIKVTGQLSHMGSQLDGIREALIRAVSMQSEPKGVAAAQVMASHLSSVGQKLDGIRAALEEEMRNRADSKALADANQTAVADRSSKIIGEFMKQQVNLVQQAMVPLVRASLDKRTDDVELARYMGQILGLTRAIAERVDNLCRMSFP